VDLWLVELRRASRDDRYVCMPFEPNDQFNGGWWDRTPYLDDDPHYIDVLLDGVEVARVELDHDFRDSMHVGAPELGASALEIQFIEVVASHRRQGIGAEVVRRIASDNPNRRLLALSEEADEFWASLGWERYDYGSAPHQYRPLFISPSAQNR
jgi:GNAT superfamily N-acetyltransferase